MEKDLIQVLAGEWRYSRTITGGLYAGGTVNFEKIGPGRLRYNETGMLQLEDGHQLAASRSYLFELSDRKLAVLFDEKPPRLFHELSLTGSLKTGLEGRGEHLCGPDFYRSEYVFRSDAVIIRHAARGPRKDYVSTTNLTRA
jgi:hypothetical protein